MKVVIKHIKNKNCLLIFNNNIDVDPKTKSNNIAVDPNIICHAEQSEASIHILILDPLTLAPSGVDLRFTSVIRYAHRKYL